MIKIHNIIFSVLMIFFVHKAFSTEVLEMYFAKNVVNREPVDVSEKFENTVGKVYCWTKIKTDSPPTYIYHVYKYNGKEMARVKLEIRYPVFRTWSYKTILPEWTGKWTVVIEDTDGNTIREGNFFIIKNED